MSRPSLHPIRSQGRDLSRCLLLRPAQLVLAVTLLALGAVDAAAQAKLRLATLAPKNTSFHKSLIEMGEKWRKSTGGAVTLTIYTDGTQGGEADMVRRMRVGQLQAGLLSVAGLLQIDESVTALQLMPMTFRDFNELDHVSEKLRPTLEKKLEEKGFVALFWADAGWVRFFSKQPARLPDDYKRMKMFVWTGDTRSSAVMRAIGINAVPLEQTDILIGLQTGLIDAVPTIPVYALAGQFQNPAPHMLDINWVPLVGACVVTKKAWDALPANQRQEMLKAAAEAGKQIRERARNESNEAVEAMKQRGLKVTVPDDGTLAHWHKFAEDVQPSIRGKVVPAEMYDEVQRLLREYRATGGKAKP